MNSYQQSRFGFRKKKLQFPSLDGDSVKPTGYRPVDADMCSFENPAYDSSLNLEPFSLPGAAADDGHHYEEMKFDVTKTDLSEVEL